MASSSPVSNERQQYEGKYERELFWRREDAANVKHRVAAFIRDDSLDARYEEKRGCYSHTARMISTANFCLKPVVFESGPYAGMKALVFAPSPAFQFEKLPKELRHMVYDEALTASGSIYMSRPSSSRMPDFTLTSVKGFPVKFDIPASPKRISLLLVNKMIGDEAVEYLYKKQHFFFDFMRDFNHDMARIGKGKRFITEITIHKSGSLLLPECYHLLSPCVRLQRFTVTLPTVPVIQRKTLVEHMEQHWQWLRVYLLANQADHSESLRRLGVIHFRIGTTQNGIVGEDGKPVKLITPELERRCKDQIEAHLHAHFLQDDSKLSRGKGKTEHFP